MLGAPAGLAGQTAETAALHQPARTNPSHLSGRKGKKYHVGVLWDSTQCRGFLRPATQRLGSHGSGHGDLLNWISFLDFIIFACDLGTTLDRIGFIAQQSWSCNCGLSFRAQGHAAWRQRGFVWLDLFSYLFLSLLGCGTVRGRVGTPTLQCSFHASCWAVYTCDSPVH